MSTKTDLLVGTIIILIFIVGVFMYNVNNTVNKIYSEIRIKSCSLPYGVQDKIEQSYEILSSATCNTTK